MSLSSKLEKIVWATHNAKRLLRLFKDDFITTYNDDVRNREIDEEVEIIRASKLFDAEWYFRNHIELQNANVDPARDYLLRGLPFRNPSALFSSQEYWSLHPDIEKLGINVSDQ